MQLRKKELKYMESLCTVGLRVRPFLGKATVRGREP